MNPYAKESQTCSVEKILNLTLPLNRKKGFIANQVHSLNEKRSALNLSWNIHTYTEKKSTLNETHQTVSVDLKKLPNELKCRKETKIQIYGTLKGSSLGYTLGTFSTKSFKVSYKTRKGFAEKKTKPKSFILGVRG